MFVYMNNINPLIRALDQTKNLFNLSLRVACIMI